jgi:hypothetical protein
LVPEHCVSATGWVVMVGAELTERDAKEVVTEEQGVETTQE